MVSSRCHASRHLLAKSKRPPRTLLSTLLGSEATRFGGRVERSFASRGRHSRSGEETEKSTSPLVDVVPGVLCPLLDGRNAPRSSGHDATIRPNLRHWGKVLHGTSVRPPVFQLTESASLCYTHPSVLRTAFSTPLFGSLYEGQNRGIRFEDSGG